MTELARAVALLASTGALLLQSAPSVAQSPPAASVHLSVSPVVDAWVSAVEGHDADAAFDLVLPDARDGMTREAFRTYFESNYDLIHRQAQGLAAPPPTPVVRAIVPVGASSVHLIQVGEAWLIEDPVAPLLPAAAPSAALRSVALLAGAHDIQGLRRLLLTDGARDALDERLLEVSKVLTEAAERLSREPPEGDRIEIPLPDGVMVVLVRTADGWRMDGLAWLLPH